MKHIQFHGKPAVPDLSQMSMRDRELLRSLINLASNAKQHLGTDDAEIRKKFDRISLLYRLSASNLPVRPDGKVLEIDTSIQDKLTEEQEPKQVSAEADPENPQEASDAITYWGDYIFRSASDASKKSK